MYRGGLLVSSCSDDDDDDGAKSVEVSLDKSSLSLTAEGDTATLVATVKNATDKTVTWSSDKENIATVSDAGVVTPLAEGTATITATSKEDSTKTATCTVTVAAKSNGGGGSGSSTALLSWTCMEYATVESNYNGTLVSNGAGSNKDKEQYTVSETVTIGSVTINADAKNSVTFDDNAAKSKLGNTEIWGYCQLTARSDAVSGYTNGKTIVFEAPAGAKKISILSKSASKTGSYLVLATGDKAGTNAKEADIDNVGDSTNGSYTTTVYEFTALEKATKFCLYNYGSGKSGLNVKGILVE